MARYKTTVDSTEQQIGQDTSLDIPVDRPLEQVSRSDLRVESDLVRVGADGLDNSYAAQLAFMEEQMDVMVHESTDPNAELMVDVYCNGTPQRFIRGQVQTVKRKYVEILARAKQTHISTKVHQDPENVYNRIDKHSALRYPFSVVRDSNPKGVVWIKSVLSAA